MLADIIRIVRSARGRLKLDLPTLSRTAEIPLDALQRFEGDEPSLSTAQLARLASKLELEPLALLRGEERPVLEPSVFLRHVGMLPDFDSRNLLVLDDALQQGRWLRELGALLQLQPEPGNGFSPIAVAGDRPSRAAQQGYRLARQVRELIGQPIEPLADLRQVLEARFHIAVLVRVLYGSNVPAVSVRTEYGAAVILNADNEERRRNPLLDRIHLAHELCHLLFDPSEGGVHLVIELDEDRRELRAEQRARGFAAELLLPEPGLRELLGQPMETDSSQQAEELVAAARQRFGTPFEVAVNHLGNHRFLSFDMQQWLLKRESPRSALTWPTVLPAIGAASVEVTARALQAHDAGRLTDGEVRELLGLEIGHPLPGAA